MEETVYCGREATEKKKPQKPWTDMDGDQKNGRY